MTVGGGTKINQMKINRTKMVGRKKTVDANTTNWNRDLQKHIYQRMMGTTTWLFPCTIGVDSTDGGGAFSSTGGNSVEEL